MKTFGQAIVADAKMRAWPKRRSPRAFGALTAARLCLPISTTLEHDRRHPPENTVIEQLAQVLNVSPDFLYFYVRRLPANVEGHFDEGSIEAAYRAFREELQQAPRIEQRRRPSRIGPHLGAWA